MDVVRDTLAVAAQASLAVRNHPDTRELAKQLFGNTGMAAALLKEPLPTVGAVGQGQSGLVGAGRTAGLLKQLRDMLHIQELQVTTTTTV